MYFLASGPDNFFQGPVFLLTTLDLGSVFGRQIEQGVAVLPSTRRKRNISVCESVLPGRVVV